MSNIWSGFTNVTAHLAHDTNMLVTVEKRKLVLLCYRTNPTGTHAGHRRRVSIRETRSSEDFKAGFAEDDDETLS